MNRKKITVVSIVSIIVLTIIIFCLKSFILDRRGIIPLDDIWWGIEMSLLEEKLFKNEKIVISKSNNTITQSDYIFNNNYLIDYNFVNNKLDNIVFSTEVNNKEDFISSYVTINNYFNDYRNNYQAIDSDEELAKWEIDDNYYKLCLKKENSLLLLEIKH